MLSAAALGTAVRVDGNGEATLAIGAGRDGDEGDGVRDAGARRVRQDLLDDRRHHHLVIAVPTAGPGWVGTGTGGAHRDASPCCHQYLPVQLGALHQRIGVPIPDERAAIEAAEALGVVLLLPGHLQTVTSVLPRRHLHLLPAQRGTPAAAKATQEQKPLAEGPPSPPPLTMTSPLVICSAQPWHSSPKRAQ